MTCEIKQIFQACRNVNRSIVLEIPAGAGPTAEKFHWLSGLSNVRVVDAFGHIDSSAVRINERLQYETGYSSYSHGVDGHSIADSEGLTNHNANGSLWIDYPGHASPPRHRRSVDIEFQIPQLSVTVLYLLYYLGARHVETMSLAASAA